MKRWLIGLGVIIIGLLVAGYIFRAQLVARFFAPTSSTIRKVSTAPELEIVAQNLKTPWSISFLPDGDMLVTERAGRLLRIGDDRQVTAIEGVRETSEGGLLGVTLDPEFAVNQRLYLYYTTNSASGLTNQVDRYRLAGVRLSDRQVIIEAIPAASNHNGGAIAVGPDDKLYITTGDAARPELAQDRQSLAGKILRLNLDGSIPKDNPFGNAVWSYGHRNPQGVAWDGDGQLWSVEHGPSGPETGRDELNLIERGGNYGWPEITGDETAAGMIAPLVQSGSSDTWAPAGLTYLDGALYFAGLRGQALYRATPKTSDSVTLERLYAGKYGRLRAVTAHQGKVYVSTSNRDGRGNPADEDDRILRVGDEEAD